VGDVNIIRTINRNRLVYDGFFIYSYYVNAKWVEKIIGYKETPLTFLLIQKILQEKIERQFWFIKKPLSEKILLTQSNQEILLIEARCAKNYWHFWKTRLNSTIHFPGRIQHGTDPVNHLLDIGYHFLNQHIQKTCEELDIPTEIGFLHKAQNKDSHPLVYDVMEWLRPYIVDHVVFSYVHKKKKPNTTITQKDIAIVVSKIQKRLEEKVYHKERKVCIHRKYWIKLYLLEIRNAVSEKREAYFVFPPKRHDTRCSLNKNTLSKDSGLKKTKRD
jgi:CRISPR-associated endonuclease Cas1